MKRYIKMGIQLNEEDRYIMKVEEQAKKDLEDDFDTDSDGEYDSYDISLDFDVKATDLFDTESENIYQVEIAGTVKIEKYGTHLYTPAKLLYEETMNYEIDTDTMKVRRLQ